jgi:hypothetical protein
MPTEVEIAQARLVRAQAALDAATAQVTRAQAKLEVQP